MRVERDGAFSVGDHIVVGTQAGRADFQPGPPILHNRVAKQQLLVGASEAGFSSHRRFPDAKIVSNVVLQAAGTLELLGKKAVLIVNPRVKLHRHLGVGRKWPVTGQVFPY